MYQDEYDRFYWSSSNGFNIEFFDQNSLQYSSSLVDDRIQTSQMELYHPTAQPTPIPLNPVENVQLILSSKKLLLKWSHPLEQSGDGCAAWNNWQYVAEIR